MPEHAANGWRGCLCSGEALHGGSAHRDESLSAMKSLACGDGIRPGRPPGARTLPQSGDNNQIIEVLFSSDRPLSGIELGTSRGLLFNRCWVSLISLNNVPGTASFSK